MLPLPLSLRLDSPPPFPIPPCPRVTAAGVRALALSAALAALAASAHAGDGVCGMNVGGATSPADLAQVESDLALSHLAEQPASTVVCSMGYMAEKCGDHVTALKIFDKCIAQGYAGAMLWKGQMLETGVGLPRDEAQAAALYRQAAESGEGHYAALGKLHYASALHQGRGVARDEAAARRWFQRAADEGSEDAAEFLRTGHHTGSRDLQGQGVGVPTEAARGQALVHQVATPLPAPSRQLQGLAMAALAALLGLGVGLRRWHRVGAPRPASRSGVTA